MTEYEQQNIHQLARIADALEVILEITSPVNQWGDQVPAENKAIRVYYSNEEDTIIREKVEKLGKVYKPKK